MNDPGRRLRLAGTLAALLAALGTILWLLAAKRYDRLPLALVTPVFVLLPAAMERLCRCRMALPVYVFGLLYALGPMLGQCWDFYYTIPWWDKLLHICGGVMFAIVGSWFFRLLTGQPLPLAQAAFALCFSITVAVLWEFFEFAADRFLGMDMQDDTLVIGICSYLLGTETGVTGRIEGIRQVAIDGVPLPVSGYIDLGLTDTMLDMLLESLGAAVTCGLLLWDRDRHPLIRPAHPTCKHPGEEP